MSDQKEMDRRTFLTALGASALLGSKLERPNVSRTLPDLIRERNDYIQQYPGRKVLFGDMNDVMSPQKIGRVSSNDHPRLKEALNDGADPEVIYEEAKRGESEIARKEKKENRFICQLKIKELI